MKYAIIANTNVIDIVSALTPPNYPPTNDNVYPTAIEIQPGTNVSIGMQYINDEFIGEYTSPVVEQTDVEIIKKGIAEVNNNQLTIMEAMAEQYEEGLERELNNMEVQATIYEAILELGGME